MSTVLLVGTGQVGVRAARQLVDTPGLDHVVIASRDPRRSTDLVEAMGDRASAYAGDLDAPPQIPDGVTAVAVAAARTQR